MEFEKILRQKCYQKVIESIQRDFESSYHADVDEYTLKDAKIYSIANAYAVYISHQRKDLSKEEQYKLFDEFEKATTAEALTQLKDKIDLEEREKTYIRYQVQYDNIYDRGARAVAEVLMRRVLLEKLQIEEINQILQVLQEESKRNERFAEQYPYIALLISGDLFQVQELLKQKIDKIVEDFFNQSINCGGYALKIDTCVFPSICDFDTKVSSLLELFPFVRLLGDTELQEDEYLVLYRARGGGHHFIRIEDDGTVVEKDGRSPIKQFENWGTLESAPEAVFAVKKEHNMEYFKEQGHIVIRTETAKNFEETVWDAIQNRKNAFEYHNHQYSLKKAGEETVYICSGEEIIAELMTDGEEYDIEIREGKQAYVSNTQPKTPIMIKDGKYQNGKEQVENSR